MKPAAVATAVALAAAAALALQPEPKGPPAQPEKAGERPGAASPNDMAAMIMKALKETPGCLGVEAAQTQSKKNVIFAWFENKAAAMAWYNSPTHAFLRRGAGGGAADHEPMAGVPDDVPVMAVASLKMAGPGEKPLPGMRIPVTEIAIEMYTPLPGGIRYGGGFAPEALKVKDRTDIAPPAAETAPPDAQRKAAEPPKPVDEPPKRP